MNYKILTFKLFKVPILCLVQHILTKKREIKLQEKKQLYNSCFDDKYIEQKSIQQLLLNENIFESGYGLNANFYTNNLLLQQYEQQQQSFLPLINQDPSMGQLAQKRQFVERLDDFDLDIIKQFILGNQKPISKNGINSSQEEDNSKIKKRQMTLRDRNNDQQKIGEDKNRKNQIKKRSSQRLSNYSQSSQNQKSSQRTLISKRQSSDTNNSKRLDDKNYDLSKTIQVNNGYKNKLEYYSRTETETEQEDDENSEDEKFEKKLSKSLKSETPITKQTQALASSINTNQNDDLSQSSLHHSKRPKRQGTQNGRYYGFETFQQRHDHSHYQLISYQNYKSQSAQPYIIYISLEALIILNIHSHLSEYEVIGFLGGYCYENQFSPQKYLIINTVIPCDSLIESQVERQKNVDLCPISANNARQIIQSRGQQVLGWYHSHPFFPVEPSLIDIRNHAVYQKNFDLANLPFIALIIGPYSTKNKNESLCKVFHLVKEKQPFSLNFKQLPNKKMRKALINEIKDILMKYKAHQDKINLKEKWCAGYTREEKLVEAIEIILEKNLKQKDKNDVQHELSTNLSSSDYQSYSQKGLFTLSTTHSEGSYSKRSDIEYTNPNSNMLDCSIINQESLEQQNLNNSNNSNAANIIVATVSNNLDQYDSNGTLLLQNLKKESYFSIENEDRVEKFMNKLKSMIGKILFQDDSSQSQNKADNCLKQERKQQFKPEQITLSS